MSVYRAQPYQTPPGQQNYDAQQAYSDMLNRLRQVNTNAAQGVYNTMQEQDANTRLSNLGLNFANDTGQQQLQASRMYGDVGQLQAQQARARLQALLDIKQLAFQRDQQRLGMSDDLTRLQYQRATQQVQNPWQQAMATLRSGGY